LQLPLDSRTRQQLLSVIVYLSVGLSIILVFAGVKFLMSDIVGKVPIWISLAFIATVVAVSIRASLHKTRGQGQEASSGSGDTPAGDARERDPSQGYWRTPE
jgi:predicted tellurium resistance membrane protein TerC